MVQSSTRKVHFFVTTKVGGWPPPPWVGVKARERRMQSLECRI